LLTYLELADVIEATEPFYNEYQFMPLKSSREILSGFDAVRSDFLSGIFATAVKAEKWFTLDLSEAVHKLKTTRSRIIKALTFLEERGDLALKVAGLRQGYRIQKPPTDPLVLKSALIERFETRERNDVNRVRQVVQLAEHPGCLVRYLLDYFGEDLGRYCGHCRNCSPTANGEIRITRETEPPHLDEVTIASLKQRYPEALSSPRQIARFLCGLSSPLLTQAKLHKHSDFGSFAEVPFQTVLEATDRLSEVFPRRIDTRNLGSE
jgi:ATP-dependent DNA helicase RecQ